MDHPVHAFDLNVHGSCVFYSLRRCYEIEVELFSPFRPMLADRGNLREGEKQMGNKEFYIEVKYDGERMQVCPKLTQEEFSLILTKAPLPLYTLRH